VLNQLNSTCKIPLSDVRTIAITGHSRGLGKYLSESLCIHHKVINVCSRIDEDLEQLLNEVHAADVFINNAHSEYAQVDLFLKLFELWKLDDKKLIINIGSRSAEPNISKGYAYSAAKSALMHAVKSVVFTSPDKRCRVTLLNLGLLNSDLPSLDYATVKEVIDFVLACKTDVEIPILYLQNSEPYAAVQSAKAFRKSVNSTW